MDLEARVAMQSLFVLAGFALVIAGFNGSRPLVFVGFGLIVVAVVGRFFGHRPD